MSATPDVGLPEFAEILSAAGGPRFALAFLNDVLGSLPVAISIYDASDEDFCVLYLNPAVESFAGPVIQPVTRRPALEVYPEALQNRVIDLFERTLDEGPQHLRGFVSHTGRHFDVDSYRIDAATGHSYLVLVAQEVTDLVSANLAKAQFMNMAAHELRTPLSVIKGYLSLLTEGTFGPTPEAWQEPMSIIAVKTVELDHLVDSVLTAARLEGEIVTAVPKIEDLRTFVRAALERAAPRASLMDAEVQGVGLDGEPILVDIAEEHVHRIVDNLINNALTYSDHPAWVRLTVGQDGGFAVVLVEDHGRGIPDEHHQSVFDQFVRVEDSNFGYPAGSGLGLYISRKLAEMYGGHLELRESVVGKGSTFELRLPVMDRNREPTGPRDLA